MKKLAVTLAVLSGLFLLYFGVGYVLDGSGSAAGFGLPHPPSGDAGGFYAVKGVRDIACGLVILVLLLTRQLRALGWAMLTLSFAPFGDMTIVLTEHGNVATALGVHGLTAALIALAGALLIRTNRRG